LKDIWIAVPTYWTYPTDTGGEETTVFDHPTPLDTEGTLGRTLASFQRLKGAFRVLVVAAAAHPDLGEAVGERVADILRPFAADRPLYLVSPRNLDVVNGCLGEPILRLDSYGNIRNVQLVVPYLAGADAVAGIDDDEVIDDTDTIAKVAEFIGEPFGGDVVGGLAGIYLDRDGDYRIAGAETLADCPNIFLKKNYFMNAALKKVMEADCPDGILPSNVAFGGNMCMARRTIAQVPHDPYIPRGEDYDYVINAAMLGIAFFFRPDMPIVHLPPDATGSQAADKLSKLVSDIRRFLYMQQKVRYHRTHFPGEHLDVSRLYPYPGPYLEEDVDLEGEAVRALDTKYPAFRLARAPEDLVAEAVALAREKAAEFFAYRERWQRTLADVAERDSPPEAVEALRVR